MVSRCIAAIPLCLLCSPTEANAVPGTDDPAIKLCISVHATPGMWSLSNANDNKNLTTALISRLLTHRMRDVTVNKFKKTQFMIVGYDSFPECKLRKLPSVRLYYRHDTSRNIMHITVITRDGTAESNASYNVDYSNNGAMVQQRPVQKAISDDLEKRSTIIYRQFRKYLKYPS